MAELEKKGSEESPGQEEAKADPVQTEGKGPKEGKEEKPKKKPGKLKKILLPLLMVAVLAGCCAGYYYYSQSVNYFVTDNAKVTAKMYSVYPVKSGQLLEWSVSEGDQVRKDQILGRQEVLPYLTAPIDGTVVKNDGSVGLSVNPATAVAIIADTSKMYIGVNIEETDITKIREGQLVDVTIDAHPGVKFRGMVTEIGQTTQTYFNGGLSSFSTSGTYTKVTQLVPVKVHIANPQGLAIQYGMNATVKIHVK